MFYSSLLLNIVADQCNKTCFGLEKVQHDYNLVSGVRERRIVGKLRDLISVSPSTGVIFLDFFFKECIFNG